MHGPFPIALRPVLCICFHAQVELSVLQTSRISSYPRKAGTSRGYQSDYSCRMRVSNALPFPTHKGEPVRQDGCGPLPCSWLCSMSRLPGLQPTTDGVRVVAIKVHMVHRSGPSRDRFILRDPKVKSRQWNAKVMNTHPILDGGRPHRDPGPQPAVGQQIESSSCGLVTAAPCQSLIWCGQQYRQRLLHSSVLFRYFYNQKLF